MAIEQDPDWIYLNLGAPRLEDSYTTRLQREEHGLSDLPVPLLEKYRRRAKAARDGDVYGPDFDYEAEAAGGALRSSELDERIGQLQERKKRSARTSVEEARLEEEIFECEMEKGNVKARLPNIDVQGLSKRSKESDRRRKETISSCDVPTTFCPLGLGATTALLRHGYLNCMNMCHLLLEGFPRFDAPPSSEELEQLARGLPRKRYPTSSAPLEPAQGA